MLKTALAIILIAHGLVHSILAVAPNPADANKSHLNFSLHQNVADCYLNCGARHEPNNSNNVS